MKRIVVRLSILAVLLSTGGFMYIDEAVDAYELACWERAYNRWTACDNAYSNVVYTFNNMNSYCYSNSSTICAASAHSYCSQQASTVCQGNPDPQCYNNSYNGCYMAQYQSCHTQTTIQCQDNVMNAYNNRAMTYASCLGIEGRFGNCLEQVDGGCLLAQDRVAACYATYDRPEDSSVLQECITASGIGQCQ